MLINTMYTCYTRKHLPNCHGLHLTFEAFAVQHGSLYPPHLRLLGKRGVSHLVVFIYIIGGEYCIYVSFC